MSTEDSPCDEYKYFWSNSSDVTLADFLSKFKPSMVQNDGTKPWIWVQGPKDPNPPKDYTKAYEEATALLAKVTKKVDDIKNDNSIPTRSNKKTGTKSKKEVREKVQEEATEELKTISMKYGCVCGKWLLFASADKVDQIWSSIAKSLVSGPLRETSAYLAKVSTSSENENSHSQHLICVYLPDVYNKRSITEVMKILLRNHGVNLSGVKSDLYTHIGIDSKHPSGIPSTVWKNTSVLDEDEIKNLRDAFFADLAAEKSAPGLIDGGKMGDSISDGKVVDTDSEDKPKLKKVVDPVRASEEKEGIEEKEGVPRKSKTQLKLKSRAAAADPFATDDEDNIVEENKGKKIRTAGIKRSQSMDKDSDDESASQPKKKKIVKK